MSIRTSWLALDVACFPNISFKAACSSASSSASSRSIQSRTRTKFGFKGKTHSSTFTRIATDWMGIYSTAMGVAAGEVEYKALSAVSALGQKKKKQCFSERVLVPET